MFTSLVIQVCLVGSYIPIASYYGSSIFFVVIDVSSSSDYEIEITTTSVLVTISFTVSAYDWLTGHINKLWAQFKYSLLLQHPSLCSFYDDSTIYSLIWTEAVGSGSSNDLEYSTAHMNEETPVNVTVEDSRVFLLFNSTRMRENAVINCIIQIFGNINISRENTFCKQGVFE